MLKPGIEPLVSGTRQEAEDPGNSPRKYSFFFFTILLFKKEEIWGEKRKFREDEKEVKKRKSGRQEKETGRRGKKHYVFRAEKNV